MEKIGLKPKKEKASQNEKFLGEVGKAQIGASGMFEAAHQAMLRESNADQSGTIRARAAGSTWQGLAGDMGSKRLATGDGRRQGAFEGLAQQGVATALRGGTNSATKLKDEVIHAGATSRLSNAQRSGASARDEARDVAREASNKVQLANQWKQDILEGATTLASAGIMHYGTKKPPGTSQGWPATAEHNPVVTQQQRTLASMSNLPPPVPTYSPVPRPGPYDMLTGYR